jgi:hypothetical protein
VAATILLGPATIVAAVVNVSPDGRETAIEPEAAPAPGTLLLGVPDVPLPDVPSWTGDLNRAVGALAFGDTDGDGDLDLACGCYFSNGFPPIDQWENLIYRNDGGTLQTTPTWVSVDERHTADLRFGDVDGDGRQDLFAANGGEGLDPSVIYLNGPAGIDSIADWAATDLTWTLGGAFCDLDGDGSLDLVTANQGNSANSVRPVHAYYNTGAGLETSPSWASSDLAISNAVAVGDLDGSSDVAVLAHTFPGDGQTTLFTLPHQPITSIERIEIIDWIGIVFYTVDRLTGRIHFGFPPPVGSTVEVDYTYSTQPDIAVTKWVNYETGVYANSSGTLSATPTWTTGDATRADKGIGLSDVDADGDPDLAFGGTDETLFYRNAGGTPTGPEWMSSNDFHSCQDLAWGDVDGDGDEDLATIHFGTGHVRLYLNRDGLLDATPSWLYDLASSGTAIAWGDVNGDGFLDLAAGTARLPIVLFLNTGPPFVGAETVDAGAPDRSTALLAHPNPSRATVTLLRRDARPIPLPARLVVSDAAGRTVRRRSITSRLDAHWDGLDESGRPVPGGVYFVRIHHADGVDTGRLVRLR